MADIKEMVIICQHCREPLDSAIFIGSTETLESSGEEGISGNMQQCRHCGKMTSCNYKDFIHHG